MNAEGRNARIIRDHRTGKRGRGSVLVGAVVLGLMLGITGLGFLRVIWSTDNQGWAEWRDARAFQAAEAGLFLGVRWLREQPSMPVADIADVFSLAPVVVNGASVQVDIRVSGDTVRVVSTAQVDELAYRKQVSAEVWLAGGGAHGLFINGINGSGAGAGPGGGSQGINNVWFDGPVHMNTSIVLSPVSNPGAGGAGVRFVNGRVSVHNSIDPDGAFDQANPWATGDRGGYGSGAYNNYDYGVFKKTLKENGSEGSALDEYFTQEFVHSQDSIFLPTVAPDPARDIVLPASKAPKEEQRAMLEFKVLGGIGQAEYTYYDSTSKSWKTTTYPVDDKIFRASGDINVLGKVKGKTSIVTASGKDIYPVGSIEYEDFAPDLQERYDDYDNSANYGVPKTGENYLTMVAGRNIHFPIEWWKPQKSGEPSSRKITGVVTVNAALLAPYAGGMIRWDTDKNGAFKPTAYDYKLRVIGARAMDQWFHYDAGGSAANERFRFYYDQRFAQGNLSPGIPAFQTKDGTTTLAIVSLARWREENIP